MKEVKNLNRVSKKFKISRANTREKIVRAKFENFSPLFLTLLALIFKKNAKMYIIIKRIVRSIIKIKPLLTGVTIKAICLKLGF